MPRIDDLLDNLNGAKYFSALDLTSGYWQISLRSDDWEKSAFHTHLVEYEWRVILFGLTNSPAVFQADINQTFAESLDKLVLIYLYDILVFSKAEDAHFVHLRTVFKKLEEAA